MQFHKRIWLCDTVFKFFRGFSIFLPSSKTNSIKISTDTNQDIFIHTSGIQNNLNPNLDDGESVDFDVYQGNFFP